MPDVAQPTQDTMLKEQHFQLNRSIERVKEMRTYVEHKVDYLVGSIIGEEKGIEERVDEIPLGIINSNFEALNILAAELTQLEYQLSRFDSI